jgi:hypothetical protein
LADLDSTGQYSGFGDGGGSENSVEGPAPNIAVAAIVSEDLVLEFCQVLRSKNFS